MPILDHLELTGYRGQPVPNTLLRHEETVTQVAVLLPGLGYTCDMPLFYYATRLVWNLGADILQVEYAYHREPGFRALPASERRERLLADATSAFDAILRQPQYQLITLVGKSLGTLAMGHLLTTKQPRQDLRAIWLTPLLRDPELQRQMRNCRARSLAVIGTADGHYDEGKLHDFRDRAGYEVIAVEGADHGLDLAGDPIGSIRVMARIVRAMEEFLTREGEGSASSAQ